MNWLALLWLALAVAYLVFLKVSLPLLAMVVLVAVSTVTTWE